MASRQKSSPVASRLKYLWLVILVSLPGIGWHGLLDHYSLQNIDASLSGAGLIYGTARGINALVSVLQGTELDLVFLTFTIGEVLDPVNDLIERFSNVIFVALGSLALQKILLAVVSNNLFNVALSLVAAGAGLSLFIAGANTSRILLKCFLIVAFLRFSLSLVVVANSWVDAKFLAAEDEQRHSAMMNFQEQLRDIDTIAQRERAAATQLLQEQRSMDAVQTRLQNLAAEVEHLDRSISAAETSLDTLIDKAELPCTKVSAPYGCPQQVKSAHTKLRKLEDERSDLADQLLEANSEGSAIEERIACLRKRQQGGACHFWEKFPETPNPAELRKKLTEINADLGEFADTCINLLTSLLLKTILIPLLFIYLLLRIFRINWPGM